MGVNPNRMGLAEVGLGGTGAAKAGDIAPLRIKVMNEA